MRKQIGVWLKEMQQTEVSLKARVEKEVLGQVISGLNSGGLTVEAAQQIARETLVAVSEIEKHEKTVVGFYEILAREHPSFEILYNRVKAEILRAHEVNAYKNALAAIDAGDMESAKNIANSAIAETADEININ